MNINYQYSDVEPQFIVCGRSLGRNVYTINYDVTELGEKERLEGRRYSYLTVTLPAGDDRRDTVISTIIESRYSSDEMTAVINNYLLDDGDEDSLAEFKEMQTWRRHAKEIADKFVATVQTL